MLKSLGCKPRKGYVGKCEYCGGEYYGKPSERGKKRYCSRLCADRVQRTGKTLTCKVCGKEYYRPLSQIKRGSSCCSYACANFYQRTNQKGEKSHTWQGGKSVIYKRLRASADFVEWRRKVFERDDYTCQVCGKRNGNGYTVILHPHHIKSFTHYPELRFDVDNGITVCVNCHKGEGFHARDAMKIKRDKLDELFSEYIRKRSGGFCQRCGKSYEWKRLQACHLHSRRKYTTRWLEINAIACCFGCHQYLDSHPQEKIDFARKLLGDDEYDRLYVLANMTTKQSPIDYKMVELYLREQIKRLPNDSKGAWHE